MEKSEFRAVIKHSHLKCLTPREIKAELYRMHGESVMVFVTIYNCLNEFKCGRTSRKDEWRGTRSALQTTAM